MMRKNRLTKLSFVLIVALFGIAATVTYDSKYFEISKNIEIFTNLYKEINTYYVDEIDPAKLMRTGVDAMLESLDPYTNYISESEIEGFRYITEGKYNGIGALIKKIDGEITITEPFEDSPAHKAGLKSGDIIKAIDGKSTAGRTDEDVNNVLKGYPNTEVVLTIQRPGVKEEQKITLVRDEVSVPNVPYSGMINQDIGYISLSTFTRNAGKNVADALKKLKEENASLKGVIFDLRGNGGGLLTEAVNISNVFIDKGELVVTTKGKVADWDRSFKTLNNPVDTDIPLVVLIDNGSASASEIVSGVIQDLDRGILLGHRSYGKGLVQNTRDVGYNSKVKMTTAKYYIPSGRCIQGVKYEAGEPVDIPDSERTPFKTRNQRTVLDGGGVKPDVLLEDKDAVQIIQSLYKQNMIFKYATEYCLRHNNIAQPEDFRFTEYEDFISFLEKQGFDYQTSTELTLDKLKQNAETEKFLESVNSDLQGIHDKIAAIKKSSLQEHKSEIIDLIEKEIISRYYFQKGKIQIGLRNDIEIAKSIELLNDKAKYNALLNK